MSNTITLSPRTVNETRAQFAYSDLKALSTDPIGPAVSIAGVVSFGTLSSSPQKRLNKMFQVVDSVSHQRGAHALRAGVDFLFNDDRINFPRSYRGAYTFSSLANFLSGTYNNCGLYADLRCQRHHTRPIRTSASMRRTSGRPARVSR